MDSGIFMSSWAEIQMKFSFTYLQIPKPFNFHLMAFGAFYLHELSSGILNQRMEESPTRLVKMEVFYDPLL